MLVDRLGRADLLDPAVVEHREAVAHPERLLLVVGDVDEGDPDLALQGLELGLHLLAELEVEGAERLVEQQHLGLVDQRAGERDALALAAGELGRPAQAEAAERHQLEHRRRAPVALGPGHALDHQAVGDVVQHAHVREQGVVLEHRVDVAIVGRHAEHALPMERDLAPIRLLEPGDQAQTRGLARARRSEHREELAVPDLEADPVDRPDRAEVAAHALEADGGLHGVTALGDRAGRPARCGERPPTGQRPPSTAM